jgi:hypothetical protein
MFVVWYVPFEYPSAFSDRKTFELIHAPYVISGLLSGTARNQEQHDNSISIDIYEMWVS